jgi:hypothetical protein
VRATSPSGRGGTSTASASRSPRRSARAGRRHLDPRRTPARLPAKATSAPTSSVISASAPRRGRDPRRSVALPRLARWSGGQASSSASKTCSPVTTAYERFVVERPRAPGPPISVSARSTTSPARPPCRGQRPAAHRRRRGPAHPVAQALARYESGAAVVIDPRDGTDARHRLEALLRSQRLVGPPHPRGQAGHRREPLQPDARQGGARLLPGLGLQGRDRARRPRRRHPRRRRADRQPRRLRVRQPHLPLPQALSGHGHGRPRRRDGRVGRRLLLQTRRAARHRHARRATPAASASGEKQRARHQRRVGRLVPTRDFHDKHTRGGFQHGLALSTAIGQGDGAHEPGADGHGLCRARQRRHVFEARIVDRITTQDGETVTAFPPRRSSRPASDRRPPRRGQPGLERAGQRPQARHRPPRRRRPTAASPARPAPPRSATSCAAISARTSSDSATATTPGSPPLRPTSRPKHRRRRLPRARRQRRQGRRPGRARDHRSLPPAHRAHLRGHRLHDGRRSTAAAARRERARACGDPAAGRAGR